MPWSNSTGKRGHWRRDPRHAQARGTVFSRPPFFAQFLFEFKLKSSNFPPPPATASHATPSSLGEGSVVSATSTPRL
jgi:hypothetical protein